MINAFVSSIHGLGEEYDDFGSVRGNGKTVSLVYSLHEDMEEGRAIFTNFKCNFSIMLPAKQILDELNNNQEKYRIKGVSIGLTEMQVVLNSLGGSPQVSKFCSYFAAQTRKRNCDVYWDAQVFWEVNNRWRNQTDNIFRPFKVHESGDLCGKDSCPELHWVLIHGIKPYAPYNILGEEVINCQEVGAMFDTNEIVFDEIIIPKKSDNSKKR